MPRASLRCVMELLPEHDHYAPVIKEMLPGDDFLSSMM